MSEDVFLFNPASIDTVELLHEREDRNPDCKQRVTVRFQVNGKSHTRVFPAADQDKAYRTACILTKTAIRGGVTLMNLADGEQVRADHIDMLLTTYSESPSLSVDFVVEGEGEFPFELLVNIAPFDHYYAAVMVNSDFIGPRTVKLRRHHSGDRVHLSDSFRRQWHDRGWRILEMNVNRDR